MDGPEAQACDVEIVEVESEAAALPEMEPVSDLQVMRREMTQAEWLSLIGQNPTPRSVGCGPDLPVAGVTFDDAVRAANRLSRMYGLRRAYRRPVFARTWRVVDSGGYRLPTVDEWRQFTLGSGEAPEGEAICDFGNVLDVSGAAVRPPLFTPHSGGVRPHHAPCDDGWPDVAPVGTYLAPSGMVYDAIGNVPEWVWDDDGPAIIGGGFDLGTTWAATTQAMEVNGRYPFAGVRFVRSEGDGS